MANQVSTDGMPTNGDNPWIDSLVWGGKWESAAGGQLTLKYAFSEDPETIADTGVGYVFSDQLRGIFEEVFRAFEAVIDIKFVEVTSDSETPDILYQLADDTSSQLEGGASGRHDVPTFDGNENGVIEGVINYDSILYLGTSSLLRGGYMYHTILHEIGHGLGLAHPHDGGTQEDGTVFPGVVSSGDTGDFDLNQAIWTAMSYNAGWTGEPIADGVVSFGGASTPMALDIAALQHLYGANAKANSGDTIHFLENKFNGLANWSTIWDTGGVDTIEIQGFLSTFEETTIDLRAATLTGEHAGGYVSWVKDSSGGFTIANGVVIENAVGSSSHDTIIGNFADNKLTGGYGQDTLFGKQGSDTLKAGGLDDFAYGGQGADTVRGGAGDDTLFGNWNDDEMVGGKGSDRLFGGRGDDFIDGFTGDDTMFGGKGSDEFFYTLEGDEGADKIRDFQDGIDLILIQDAQFSDVTISASGKGGKNTLISLETGTTIVLSNINHSNISASDFDFG